MRILHAISGIDPAGGGTASALTGLAAAQARQGLHVTVAATFSSACKLAVVDRLREAGARVHLIGPAAGPLFRHADIPSVLESLASTADVIHVHALWEEIQHQACRTARHLRIPYIITPHGMLDPWSLRQGWLKKRLYMLLRMRRHLDHAAAIHFTSEVERDACARLRLRPPAVVEPLGVDLHEFEELPPTGMLRARFPAIAGRRIILFLGRIHRGKGLEYLVPALAQLPQDLAALVIVGPDSRGHQAVVEQNIRQLGLTDRVFFTGFMGGADRVAALVDADLLALPSDHENFGIAVVEALAAGTPVVISDHVNIHREIRAAGVGGVIPNRTDAVAHELQRWLQDDRLRSSVAEKCRPFAWEHYDWQAVARHWIEHYQAIAAPAGAPPHSQLPAAV